MSVFMRHADLPDNDPIQVAESAVPQHRAQGWEVIDPPAAEPGTTDEADGKPPRGKNATRASSAKKGDD